MQSAVLKPQSGLMIISIYGAISARFLIYIYIDIKKLNIFPCPMSFFPNSIF